MKDPFTSERGAFMVLGGNCSCCHQTVCCNQVKTFSVRYLIGMWRIWITVSGKFHYLVVSGIKPNFTELDYQLVLGVHS